ncbi:MAG: response regulator transcription factor [Bacteroidales bacterium]|nr:response regulator transcription factor [Bacteroidales bacterium]
MNILIVEDHPLIRLSYKKIMEILFDHFNIFETDNLIETSNILKTHELNFAIVDLNLKGISGFNIIKLIKKQQPFCKIAVVSLYDEIETIWICKKIGADGFISKTCNERDFESTLKLILENNNSFITNKQLNEKLTYLFSDDINYFFEEFSKLTEKEKIVFKLKINQFKNTDISKTLNIKLKTVENYITRISTKCIPSNYNFHDFVEKYKNTINFIISQE